MRWLMLSAAVLASAPAYAQASGSPAARDAQQQHSWRMTTDLWGNSVHQTLTLRPSEARATGGRTTGSRVALSGDLDGDAATGVLEHDRLDLVVTDKDGAVYRFSGRIQGDVLNGTTDQPDTNDAAARAIHDFRAQRLPMRPADGLRTWRYEPTRWSNLFSADVEPALFVWPGDTIVTRTLDSGGVDEKGVTRALFGNPQTGPFYISGAKPGDVLAVHIRKLTLNRDTADSLDGVVGRAQSTALAPRVAYLGRRVRWTLDRTAGVARLQDAPENLKDYTIPLAPMLGGIGVAPGFGAAALSTGDTGRGGGNMDFNAIVEGATVYLPVMQPGALLYFGDAHAAQGDGETTQWALETSMDVEVTVDLIANRPLATPRVESDTHIRALGQGGSLDDATRAATAGLIQWLEQDYGLSVSEASLVLGSAVEYGVENLAGRSVGVSAGLAKARLTGLKRKSAN